MTVIINIWRGELPKWTVYNAIYGKDVGHASISVVDDKNPQDEIYISHRPQHKKPINIWEKLLVILNIDTSKKYAFGKSFTPKAEWISFNEDCQRRRRKPDNQIHILGLNESRIREFYKRYFNNNLPEYESQYHIRKNNCSTVVVYFIRKGLGCPQESCDFCSNEMNQPDHKKQKFLASSLQEINNLVNLFVASDEAKGCSVLVCILFVLWLLLTHRITVSQIIHFIEKYSVYLKDLMLVLSLLVFLLFLPFSVVIFILKEGNLESHVIKSNKNKFWSPRTLEYFAEKVKIETEQNPPNLCWNFRIK
ncbi:MAG: hypothetical protein F6K24_41425 [Okeania sp. SIO2D1]|nr:hypothetical protein [Okeania sp. SIO2D1]